MKFFVQIRRHWIRYSVLAILPSGLLIAVILLTYPHWWGRMNNAAITYDGEPNFDCKVYKSVTGYLLIDLPDSGMYIVDIKAKIIGMTNPAAFVVLPGFIYSKDNPATFAKMNRIKSTEPHLQVTENSIEFNSVEEVRVRVSW